MATSPNSSKWSSARACALALSARLNPIPPMIADELRRQADDFIELQDLAKEISRAHQPRPESAEDDGLDDDFTRNTTTIRSSNRVEANSVFFSPPGRECDLCPRLVEFRHRNREKFPDSQCAGRQFRLNQCGPSDCRSCTWSERGKSQQAPLYRRLCRPPPLSDNVRIRICERKLRRHTE